MLLARTGGASTFQRTVRGTHANLITERLELTVNEEKTRICKSPEGEFDFLGYTFGRLYWARTGQARLGYRPLKKSIKRIVDKVHALTDRSTTWQETTALVGRTLDPAWARRVVDEGAMFCPRAGCEQFASPVR
jgi:hypothetical protein